MFMRSWHIYSICHRLRMRGTSASLHLCYGREQIRLHNDHYDMIRDQTTLLNRSHPSWSPSWSPSWGRRILVTVGLTMPALPALPALIFLLIAGSAKVQAQQGKGPPPPRLILVLTIDQMRADYLTR